MHFFVRKKDRELSEVDLELALKNLEILIDFLHCLDPNDIEERQDPLVQYASKRVRCCLKEIFGEGTPRFKRYESAARLDRMPRVYGDPIPLDVLRDHFREDRGVTIEILNKAAADLLEQTTGAIPTTPR